MGFITDIGKSVLKDTVVGVGLTAAAATIDGVSNTAGKIGNALADAKEKKETRKNNKESDRYARFVKSCKYDDCLKLRRGGDYVYEVFNKEDSLIYQTRNGGSTGVDIVDFYNHIIGYITFEKPQKNGFFQAKEYHQNLLLNSEGMCLGIIHLDDAGGQKSIKLEVGEWQLWLTDLSGICKIENEFEMIKPERIIHDETYVGFNGEDRMKLMSLVTIGLMEGIRIVNIHA